MTKYRQEQTLFARSCKGLKKREVDVSIRWVMTGVPGMLERLTAVCRYSVSHVK